MGITKSRNNLFFSQVYMLLKLFKFIFVLIIIVSFQKFSESAPHDSSFLYRPLFLPLILLKAKSVQRLTIRNISGPSFMFCTKGPGMRIRFVASSFSVHDLDSAWLSLFNYRKVFGRSCKQMRMLTG